MGEFFLQESSGILVLSRQKNLSCVWENHHDPLETFVMRRCSIIVTLNAIFLGYAYSPVEKQCDLQHLLDLTMLLFLNHAC